MVATLKPLIHYIYCNNKSMSYVYLRKSTNYTVSKLSGHMPEAIAFSIPIYST